MSGIYFLSENNTDNAQITITTGSANAQFPVSNIQNESPSYKFRSTGNTVVLEFDLLQTRAIDIVAIVGDPTGTLGVTSATFKTAVTNDFSGSPVNTLDISAEQNIGLKQITPVSHRYLELTLTGTGSFCEFSNIFIGEAINLTQLNLSIGSFRYGYSDKSVVKQNKYGQSFIDTRNLVKSLQGSIEFCTTSEQEILDDMFVRHGKHLPIWMLVDVNSDGMTNGKYKLSIYGYLTETPQWSASGGQTYNTSVNVRQAI